MIYLAVGKNNPIYIEQMLYDLKQYENEIQKSLDIIEENITFINKLNNKLVDKFEENQPINARKIAIYIDDVDSSIYNISNSTELDYFKDMFDDLKNNVKNLRDYYENQYLKTLELEQS